MFNEINKTLHSYSRQFQEKQCKEYTPFVHNALSFAREMTTIIPYLFEQAAKVLLYSLPKILAMFSRERLLPFTIGAIKLISNATAALFNLVTTLPLYALDAAKFLTRLVVNSARGLYNMVRPKNAMDDSDYSDPKALEMNDIAPEKASGGVMAAAGNVFSSVTSMFNEKAEQKPTEANNTNNATISSINPQ